MYHHSAKHCLFLHDFNPDQHAAQAKIFDVPRRPNHSRDISYVHGLCDVMARAVTGCISCAVCVCWSGSQPLVVANAGESACRSFSLLFFLARTHCKSWGSPSPPKMTSEKGERREICVVLIKHFWGVLDIFEDAWRERERGRDATMLEKDFFWGGGRGSPFKHSWLLQRMMMMWHKSWRWKEKFKKQVETHILLLIPPLLKKSKHEIFLFFLHSP